MCNENIREIIDYIHKVEEDLQVAIVAVAGSNLQVVPTVGEPEGSEGDSGQLALRCHYPLGTYHSYRNR